MADKFHFLYPSNPLDSKEPDENYQGEAEAVVSDGFNISLFSFEKLQDGGSKITPSLSPDVTVIYRGWMLSQSEYSSLLDLITKAGGRPLTDLKAYLSTHHFPNWYPLIKDFTPETKILGLDQNLEQELQKIGWKEFFVKDYVKSLKTSTGSRITRPEDIQKLVSEMKTFRGQIEGGICVRKVESFLPETETRYFVFNGNAHSPNGIVPEIVNECAQRIKSPFFSVDVIQRDDGLLRVVEVGDGQVSDLVGWTPGQFAKIFNQ
jgi:hypothetical protein